MRRKAAGSRRMHEAGKQNFLQTYISSICDSEVGGFTICKADEISRDGGVVSDPATPVKQETMNFGFASVVRPYFKSVQSLKSSPFEKK